MFPGVLIINCLIILQLAIVFPCDAFVEGWIWKNYLPGYHCTGVPVPQDTFTYSDIAWERFVVQSDDWTIGDLPGFEICLPRPGMRIFRGFTFRGLQPKSFCFSNTEKDNEIAFFVMGLYDGCTIEELYSSGTLCIWAPDQFKYKYGNVTPRDLVEKLAIEYANSNNNIDIEYWPEPNIEISLTIDTNELIFKILVSKTGVVYQLFTSMPNVDHKNFFLESFKIYQ